MWTPPQKPKFNDGTREWVNLNSDWIHCFHNTLGTLGNLSYQCSSFFFLHVEQQGLVTRLNHTWPK